jgi:tRNA-specific 2-thiouridylase
MVGDKASVVLAMSGGVDSSAAAAALVEGGYRVIGVTFRMWEEGWSSTGKVAAVRCSHTAVEEAAGAAQALGIEHVVIDLRERFLASIVEPFAREYMHGRTPNPCVECNRSIKFPTLVEVADEMGAPIIASGHYARAECDVDGVSSLRRAAAREKDQSYVLYGLGGEELSRCLFPNGGMSKEEVRELAAAHGLDAARSEESQEICFLCGGDYRDLVSRRHPEALAPGPVEDTSGKKLGEHHGVAFFTVGQRRGLGISESYPLYVVALDAGRRAVIVGSREEVPGDRLRAEEPLWTTGGPPGDSFTAEAMVRYNAIPASCRVEVSGEGFELSFSDRVWALTPGQHAVLYRGDEVLGGGVITSAR